jgi:hypothetical protein
MLKQKRIKNIKCINFLNKHNYSNLWFQENPNIKKGKNKFFLKDTDTFGIYEDNHLKGVFILEHNADFVEPHIFLIKKLRNSKTLKFIKSILPIFIEKHTRLIGKIGKNKKNVFIFAKWLGFKKFIETKDYYFVGMTNKKE